MRWSRTPYRGPQIAALLLLSAAAVHLALRPPAAVTAQESSQPRRLAIFSPAVGFSIPLAERGAREYVGLLESLEPFGEVSARVDGRRWRLRFNRMEALFTQSQTEARIRNQDVQLAAEFLIEGERGMVPVESLPVLLNRFLNARVEYHRPSSRIFVGEAAIRFQAALREDPPAAVVLTFTRPVNPFLATEPGRLRMLFRNDPVISSGVRELSFDSALIPGARYLEGNGMVELVFTGTAPLLATFGDGGRTITISAAPAPPKEAAAAPEPVPALPAEAAPVAEPPPPLIPARPRFFVLVDAGHGGGDGGAALADDLLEKDVTLALARRLRYELGSRGLHAVMAREGDHAVSLEQRALLANTERAGLYVSLHAGAPGSGVRVYTALLEDSAAPDPTALLPWDSAQGAHLESSRRVAQTVAAELGARNIPVMVLSAPLRPLRSVAAPAIAIEIAAGPAELDGLRSPQHQQALAAALAEALAAARARMPQTATAARTP